MRVSSLPIEASLQSVSASSHECDVDEDQSAYAITSINSTEHTCIMSGSEQICKFGYSRNIYPKSVLCANFSFENAAKSFSTVRVRLVQSELRSDRSRVQVIVLIDEYHRRLRECVLLQEKVVDTVVRHISHALSIPVRLNLPSNQAPSFVSPIVQVRLQYVLNSFIYCILICYNLRQIAGVLYLS